MPITLTADKLDELPEPIRPNAKEANGKFHVDALPDGWGVDHAAQSRAKITKLEQDVKRAAERMKVFAKDEKGTIYEPDEFTALQAEYRALKEAQGKQPNIDELRKQVVADAESRYSKKLTEAEKRAQDLDRELDNAILGSTLDNLLAQSRPREGKAEIVRLLLREHLGLDKADGKRQVRVKDSAKPGEWMLGNDPDGYMPAKDYALNNLRVKHADLFEGDGASGAGATSTGTVPRRAKYTFPASRLNGNASEFLAMKARAAAEGMTVTIDENA